MKYTMLENVNQGDKLGESIYTGAGRVLLEEGVVLTIGLISRLRHLGVNAIYLKDDRLDDVKIEEIVTESTKREAIVKFSESVQYIQNGKKDLDMKGISKTTEKLIEEILQNQNILISLTDIRTNDNSLYVHSTNVCIMSVFIGIRLGLSRSEIKDLAIGALFHDIGKIVDPSKLDQKSIKATNATSDHTWVGFNLLRKKHEISTVSAHVALGHHENIDGRGYPRKVTGDQIPLFAKIVAVANYYDNLVSPLNQTPLHPHEACERILALTNSYFDHQVVWEFLRSIAFYPIGRQVKLTTGEIGVIVGQNHGLPQRPIVRIFDVFNRSKFEDYNVKEIDLGEQTTIFITKVL